MSPALLIALQSIVGLVEQLVATEGPIVIQHLFPALTNVAINTHPPSTPAPTVSAIAAATKTGATPAGN
jgi:hypothetical protein